MKKRQVSRSWRFIESFSWSLEKKKQSERRKKRRPTEKIFKSIVDSEQYKDHRYERIFNRT